MELNMTYKIDDGKPWGWMDHGVWQPLPKIPMMQAGFGPAPFWVELPSGERRYICHDPATGPQPVSVRSARRERNRQIFDFVKNRGFKWGSISMASRKFKLHKSVVARIVKKFRMAVGPEILTSPDP
jgi:hypothetical protein